MPSTSASTFDAESETGAAVSAARDYFYRGVGFCTGEYDRERDWRDSDEYESGGTVASCAEKCKQSSGCTGFAVKPRDACLSNAPRSGRLGMPAIEDRVRVAGHRRVELARVLPLRLEGFRPQVE